MRYNLKSLGPAGKSIRRSGRWKWKDWVLAGWDPSRVLAGGPMTGPDAVTQILELINGLLTSTSNAGAAGGSSFNHAFEKNAPTRWDDALGNENFAFVVQTSVCNQIYLEDSSQSNGWLYRVEQNSGDIRVRHSSNGAANATLSPAVNHNTLEGGAAMVLFSSGNNSQCFVNGSRGYTDISRAGQTWNWDSSIATVGILNASSGSDSACALMAVVPRFPEAMLEKISRDVTILMDQGRSSISKASGISIPIFMYHRRQQE